MTKNPESELTAECFELARSTQGEGNLVDAAKIQDLAERFAQIARTFMSDELEIDLPLLTRAVRYLRQVHAIPPMADDTQWFFDMMSAVIEIARPNTSVDESSHQFLRDMRDGINSLMEE